MSSSRSLTEGPVSRALFRLAAPMVVGVIAVLSVSLVDTYFVGKLGTDALAALAFTFPVTFTLSSLAIGLGAGAASVLSRVLGAKDNHRARRLATDSLILAFLVVTVTCVGGFFSIRPVFALLGASGPILDMIVRYMQIWFVSMPFLVIPMVSSALIRAAGDAFWPSVIMVLAAVVNVVLTPAFVFGWGPIPRLEIEGAAIASLIARATTLVFTLYLLTIREKLVTLRRPSLSESLESWRAVLSVAIPAAAGNMISPIAVGFVTALLARYGPETVAAFGVGTRIEAFAAIPMLALSSAIGPVAGQ
ncbi:MAG: MATE family efflux transporter, partial [Myxococcota bacterium]